jgi:hypothetical protein
LRVAGGVMAGSGGPPEAAVDVARGVLAAVSEGRVGEVLELVDPEVVWKPVTRPGRTVYFGHEGMAQVAADLRGVYGPFGLAVEDTGEGCEAAGSVHVTLRVRVVRQDAGGGESWGRPVLADFTVREGRVTVMESRWEN